jgi:hypothetical protein
LSFQTERIAIDPPTVYLHARAVPNIQYRLKPLNFSRYCALFAQMGSPDEAHQPLRFGAFF